MFILQFLLPVLQYLQLCLIIGFPFERPSYNPSETNFIKFFIYLLLLFSNCYFNLITFTERDDLRVIAMKRLLANSVALNCRYFRISWPFLISRSRWLIKSFRHWNRAIFFGCVQIVSRIPIVYTKCLLVRYTWHIAEASHQKSQELISLHLVIFCSIYIYFLMFCMYYFNRLV